MKTIRTMAGVFPESRWQWIETTASDTMRTKPLSPGGKTGPDITGGAVRTDGGHVCPPPGPTPPGELFPSPSRYL